PSPLRLSHLRPPPTSTLFPYTTLFRSPAHEVRARQVPRARRRARLDRDARLLPHGPPRVRRGVERARAPRGRAAPRLLLGEAPQLPPRLDEAPGTDAAGPPGCRRERRPGPVLRVRLRPDAEGRADDRRRSGLRDARDPGPVEGARRRRAGRVLPLRKPAAAAVAQERGALREAGAPGAEARGVTRPPGIRLPGTTSRRKLIENPALFRGELRYQGRVGLD